ncbi:MAG: hypothetical protein K2G33_01785 [Duncaniella sp.]|nr:hypothetical protein [Duncaniella sp.]
MKGLDRFKYIILSHRRRDIALPPPSEAMGMARRYFLQYRYVYAITQPSRAILPVLIYQTRILKKS